MTTDTLKQFSNKFSRWIIGFFMTALIAVSGFLYTSYKESVNTLNIHKTRLAVVEDRLNIVTKGQTKDERAYWHWFKMTHHGKSLGPTVQGGFAGFAWDIPVRPQAAMEIQIAVILDETGKIYKGTTGPFITVPEDKENFGRERSRYRTSIIDRRVSHFNSTEGIPLPAYLKPGKYTMNYQYLFLDKQGNITRVSTNQLIHFEIISKTDAVTQSDE